jgi:thioesterase domain-containing protein
LDNASFYLKTQTTHGIRVDEGCGRQDQLLWIGGGAVLRAVASHLGGALPLVSLFLRQQELTSLSPPYKFEDLAALIVEKMLALQPEGPYFIGGWCQEGLLAYEVAQQLQHRGCDMRLLVMVDVPTPDSENLSRARKLVKRLQLEGFHLSVMSALPLSQWKEYLVRRVEWFVTDSKRRMWKAAYRRTEACKRPARSFAEVLDLSADSYRPLPYSGAVLFLQPKQRPAGSSWNTAAGWKDLVTRLDIVELPGDHTTMFRDAGIFTGCIHQAIHQPRAGASFSPSAR